MMMEAEIDGQLEELERQMQYAELSSHSNADAEAVLQCGLETALKYLDVIGAQLRSLQPSDPERRGRSG